MSNNENLGNKLKNTAGDAATAVKNAASEACSTLLLYTMRFHTAGSSM